jgi:hypothetical protein
MAALGSVLLCFMLAGCPVDPPSETINVTSNVVAPDGKIEMQAAFASALTCDPTGLLWSIQEQVANPTAWNTSVDGSIAQNGVLSAPKCGSPWVGSTIHVQAYCSSNNKLGTAAITTAQENISTVAISDAVVNQCGEPACRMANPTAINVRLCLANEPQTTIQFFSKLTFTCSTVYSPDLPANYATLPVCSF